jgi:hypothetical protein
MVSNRMMQMQLPKSDNRKMLIYMYIPSHVNL